jgi:hypothetical protein
MPLLLNLNQVDILKGWVVLYQNYTFHDPMKRELSLELLFEIQGLIFAYILL